MKSLQKLAKPWELLNKMVEIFTATIDEFIDYPFELYKDDPYYVPELKSDTKHLLTKDPLWLNATRVLYVAKRKEKIVGRIAAIVNKAHDAHWQERAGFFGFFECENDQKTANALFDAAEAWLKAQGSTFIRGPMNPSTNHTCGLLIDNFDKMPFIMMPYNPPYYATLIEGAGFKKVKDLVAFERTDKDDFSPRMKKILARIERNKSITKRHLNLKNFDEEVEMVQRLYNASWAENWGNVPISKAEIAKLAKDLKLILKPEITSVIEIDGEPAAFAISIPNMNPVLKILNGSLNLLKLPRALWAWHKIRDIRMIMLGVDPKHRNRGLDLLLVKHVVVDGVKNGWNKAELSWLLEDNQGIISVVEEAGCHKTKTYRIYQKEI